MFSDTILTAIHLASLAIQLVAYLWIFGTVLLAGLKLLRSGIPEQAKVVTSPGLLAALAILTAATLLNLIALRTWQALGIFSMTFALRTLLKYIFAHEQAPAGQAETTSTR